MRSLDDLLETTDPAILQIERWMAVAANTCERLPPSEENGTVLHTLQATTRSTLGAVAYETGGLLVDHRWLRSLGSGHPKLPRNLADWNSGRSKGYLLVADDAVGGSFAINGGALGDSFRNIYRRTTSTGRIWASAMRTSCSGHFLPG
jgi:uncharacterized protein DUF2625